MEAILILVKINYIDDGDIVRWLFLGHEKNFLARSFFF